MDYSRINDELNNGRNEEATEVKVSLITLGGVNEITITPGMTVSEFKSRYDLDDTKLVTEEGDTLLSNDVIRSNMQLFVSTPKKNG